MKEPRRIFKPLSDRESRIRCRRSCWAVSLALVLAACGEGSAPRSSILISAASSLGPVLIEIERQFEEERPSMDVVVNLGGSSALLQQILSGAPVDVFASADPELMETLEVSGALAGRPQLFGRNRLSIGVPKDNPAGVMGLADFGRPELLIGLCAAEVPCGVLARRALAGAGVAAAVDTEEASVRALVAKLVAGELDAGIVYATDVLATQLDSVAIPESLDQAAHYSIGVLTEAVNPEGARDLVQFVLSDEGRKILSEYGFAAP